MESAIVSLTIKIDGVDHIMSIDDARKLYVDLALIFERKDYVLYPYTPAPNPLTYPLITYCTN